ncbi:hypothetical protein AB0F88_22945 [Streptosporangium sp. NPDC023963]|uniref:hypothetical protein n=1 Tax=Streptosporangium sp. NPDC023963 TaxID=3155608 RepID=UPI0034286750
MIFWELVDRYTVPVERQIVLPPDGVGQTVRVYTPSTSAAVWARMRFPRSTGTKG